MMKKFFIGIVILLIVVLTFVGIYYKFENIKNIENKKILNYTYLAYILNEGNENESIDSCRLLFAFDENDICVLSRFVWNFKTEEIAKENYQNWKKSELLNLKINGTEVSFNDVEQLNKTKSEIRKIGFGDFEILEY